MEAILALDLGTTALKCVLYGLNGNELASARVEYPLIAPSPLVVEMDVETYWEAFKTALRVISKSSEINPAHIRALGISAQGETLIMIDEKGQHVRRAIVWLDSRAQLEADELGDRFGHRSAYEITGQVKIVPTWPAAKILWLQRNEPEVVSRVAKFLLIEDYFIYRLTGEYVSEGSLNTSTSYWNFKTKQWWPEMLDYIGVSGDQLPQIWESGVAVGKLQSAVADELGLTPNTIVCTGALDNACSAIAVGNFAPGVFNESTGASLAICATVSGPTLDPNNSVPCHYHGIPDRYMLHTFTTGGMVLCWFRDEFAQMELGVAKASGQDAYDYLNAQAALAPPGCDGLLMLPHLQGAMSPENNPRAMGVYYGFTLHHGRNHFVRAIMEAVCFSIRRNVEAMERLGIEVKEIRALGGGAKSPVWKQIEADITQRPVLTTTVEEAATLGAAVLAGKAVGIYTSIEEAVGQMVQIKDRYEPVKAHASIYDEAFETYKQLYEQLCPVFENKKRS